MPEQSISKQSISVTTSRGEMGFLFGKGEIG